VRGTACLGGDRAYLVVDHLPRNDAAREIYVLWWQDAAAGMHPVEGFDVTGDGPSVYALPLAVAPGDVRGLAVSLERGRTVPARPATPIASGTVGTA
jgi:hypothetical protein